MFHIKLEPRLLLALIAGNPKADSIVDANQDIDKCYLPWEVARN
jgi:hypothetical protein